MLTKWHRMNAPYRTTSIYFPCDKPLSIKTTQDNKQGRIKTRNEIPSLDHNYFIEKMEEQSTILNFQQKKGIF